ncbi:hypothetical protein BDV30DRAFT_207771 [Aspergillus minisclerotigenes]|uniref:Ankyrin repeat-containing domain protein n=1 Tax=Aspergillus minisclerotigenes TaxID=656917 RepID=A0A5N6J8X4_9EURO|nr:hypothetical protein BDV30DRAFT_207771 [Aspergillus minisclerotigenes]
MAELLISHGADPHVTNFEGRTALFPAVSLHHNALVAFLQQAGLTMDKRDNCDMTPAMHLSVHSNNILSPIDQEIEEWFDSKLLDSTLLRQLNKQFEDEVHDDVFDTEEELLEMSPDGMGPESTQNPFPRMDNALHSIGLSRQQLSSISFQTRGNVEPPNVFEPFNEIELVHRRKILDEKPFKPVLGRRFPTQN